LFLTCITLIISLQITSAQEPAATASVPDESISIEVKESKEKMSLGVNNCIKVFIPEATKEDVERDLLKYMKNYNVKGDAKKSEYFFDNAEIKAFGNNLVDMYALIEQKAGGVDLKAFFDLGGAFLSSSGQPEKYKEAEDIVRRFAREEAVAAVGIQIATSQKTLDTRLREYDNLVRQDSAYSKKIHDCQAIIKQAEMDQQANRLIQETKKNDLVTQQQLKDALKSKQAKIE
ncbi:MAG: hypothetical protein ABI729_08600, partial [Chitinophagales bacterium]